MIYDTDSKSPMELIRDVIFSGTIEEKTTIYILDGNTRLEAFARYSQKRKTTDDNYWYVKIYREDAISIFL